MRLILCEDPLVPTQVHPYFAFEASVAASLGIPCSLIRFEDLVESQDAAGAVRSVLEAAAPEAGVYRGWMMDPERKSFFPIKFIIRIGSPSPRR